MRYSYACIHSYMPPVVRLSLFERWTWGVYLNCAAILVRSVYQVRQAPDESAQEVTQKTDWKRSFTLSFSGVEPTVALLSQDPQQSALTTESSGQHGKGASKNKWRHNICFLEKPTDLRLSNWNASAGEQSLTDFVIKDLRHANVCGHCSRCR